MFLWLNVNFKKVYSENPFSKNFYHMWKRIFTVDSNNYH